MHELINRSQRSFTNDGSCLIYLLSYYTILVEMIKRDEDNAIRNIFSNKTFNKIFTHEWQKLKARVRDGNILNRIRVLLDYKNRRVQIKGYKLDWGCVTNGVLRGLPCGSVFLSSAFIFKIRR